MTPGTSKPFQPSAPQISFMKWILGGPLVDTSRSKAKSRHVMIRDSVSAQKRRTKAKDQDSETKAKPEAEAEAGGEKKGEEKVDKKEGEEKVDKEGGEDKTGKEKDNGKVGEAKKGDKKEDDVTVVTITLGKTKKTSDGNKSEMVNISVDASSKTESATTNAENDDAAKNTTAGPAVVEEEAPLPFAGGSDDADTAAAGWTAAQDAQIRDLKAAGHSWRYIAAAVGATRAEVQRRFKELEKEAKAAPPPPPPPRRRRQSTPRQRHAEPQETEPQKTEPQKTEPEQPPSQWQWPPQWHPQWQSQWQSQWQQQQPPQQQPPRQWPHPPPPPQQQQRPVWPQAPWLPPQPRRLHPDEFWSRRDCDILEYLESNQEQGRWKNLQCGFYNLTGRMIAAKHFEDKFKELAGRDAGTD